MDRQDRVFTLCGVADFYPEINLLTNSSNGKRVTLNWPTSRCLQLLIENQGVTIPRTFFMQHVWGSKNLIVSKNTFVQNISLLRSSLEYIGIPKTLVKTIKGEGYTIPSGYEITQMLTPGMSIPLENTSTGVRKTTQLSLAEPTLAKSTNFPLQYYTYLLIILLLLGLLITHCLTDSDDRPSLNYRYKLSNAAGCSLFFDGSEGGFIKTALLVEKNDLIDCQKFQYIYLTAYFEVQSYNVIQCNMAIDSVNQRKNCVSITRFNYDEKI